MATIVKAPEKFNADKFSIFLGGTIDQGKAELWQKYVGEQLIDYDLLILDPRRDDWDASWKQEETNAQFAEQVNWELDAQEIADLRIYVFGSNSMAAELAKAPITLLEIGLFADTNCYVCCPTGYYRKGNVVLTCRRKNIPVFETLDELLTQLKLDLHQYKLGAK